MRIDKKVKSGRMRLVLLRSIGESFVTADYSQPALLRTLEEHFGARSPGQTTQSAVRP
jgi:3-dehydroquinate synthase